jgi:hypothetical protein
MRIPHAFHNTADRKSYKSRLDRPGPDWVGISERKSSMSATGASEKLLGRHADRRPVEAS